MNLHGDYFAGTYMQLAELQPAQRYHHFHYDVAQASSSAVSYDMTAGGGGEGGGDGLPVPALPPAHHQHLQQSKRKRRISQISNEYNAMPVCEEPHRSTTAPLAPPAAPPPRLHANSTRRRKNSSAMIMNNAYDDEAEECRGGRMLPDRKQNHSEIEKRRRDKMNTYISELSALIPMCNAMSRKLDKLTVLRMAVQHMRTVRGALSTCPLTSCPRPSYVTERELNDLVLAVGRDAFVIVVGCDRGRLLYLSNSIEALLLYDKSELIGQSLFDILHPKDVAKVKEQLSSLDLTPRERLIDAKTLLPVKADTGSSASRLCPGARRSFFCRIKARAPVEPVEAQGAVVKQETEPAAKVTKKSERKYCVVQCTGYLKSWAPSEISTGGGSSGVEGAEEETSYVNCLVAVGRALHNMDPSTPSTSSQEPGSSTRSRKLMFTSRHTNDGKYMSVDQRVTMVLGYLPQELIGTSLYEHVSESDLAAVARAHKLALVRIDAVVTPPYTVNHKDGSSVLLRTCFRPFRNPWTKEVEFMNAEHYVVPDPSSSLDNQYNQYHGQFSVVPVDAADGDAELQQLIDSQVGSHKIGSTIAEDALRRPPLGLSADLLPELMHEALYNSAALVESMVPENMPPSHQQVRNNVTLSLAAAGGVSPAPDSPTSMTIDGNGEAAMAVIMSLLEADAGLGGPVNFNSLPWPLP